MYIVDAAVTSIDSKLIIKAYPSCFHLQMNVKDFPSLFDPKSSLWEVRQHFARIPSFINNS